MRLQDHINSFIPVIKHWKSKLIIIKYRFLKQSIRLGINIEIYNKCSFEDVVTIGDYSRVFNIKVGTYSYIGPNSFIIDTEIGKFCSIGPGVKIGLGIHPLDKITTSPYFYESELYGTFTNHKKVKSFDKVIIGHDVWIGANVMIMGGIKIGNGAVIGGGSIVNKDVAPYSIVVGSPAKHIRFRIPEEQIKELEKIEWYNWELKKIKENATLFMQNEKFIKNFAK